MILSTRDSSASVRSYKKKRSGQGTMDNSDQTTYLEEGYFVSEERAISSAARQWDALHSRRWFIRDIAASTTKRGFINFDNVIGHSAEKRVRTVLIALAVSLLSGVTPACPSMPFLLASSQTLCGLKRQAKARMTPSPRRPGRYRHFRRALGRSLDQGRILPPLKFRFVEAIRLNEQIY